MNRRQLVGLTGLAIIEAGCSGTSTSTQENVQKQAAPPATVTAVKIKPRAAALALSLLLCSSKFRNDLWDHASNDLANLDAKHPFKKMAVDNALVYDNLRNYFKGMTKAAAYKEMHATSEVLRKWANQALTSVALRAFNYVGPDECPCVTTDGSGGTGPDYPDCEIIDALLG